MKSATVDGVDQEELTGLAKDLGEDTEVDTKVCSVIDESSSEVYLRGTTVPVSLLGDCCRSASEGPTRSSSPTLTGLTKDLGEDTEVDTKVCSVIDESSSEVCLWGATVPISLLGDCCRSASEGRSSSPT
jgi:hypothetical protein